MNYKLFYSQDKQGLTNDRIVKINVQMIVLCTVLTKNALEKLHALAIDFYLLYKK